MNQVLLLTVLALAGPTYADVAPILERKCCGCHRKGLAAPMALDNYAEAAAWAESIREAVEGGRMPPWHADPAIGRWANDRSLSAVERRHLFGWLDAGCPEGGSASVLTPPPATGWRITPDVVISMPQEQSLPAAGNIPYRRVVAPTGFNEDVWVSAIEVRPGNRKAVHHALVFAAKPEGELYVEYGFLAAYLPGDDPMVYPAGYAKRIPAGKPVVFQMHYVTTGKPETDRTSIGLVLARGPVGREVRSLNVEANQFVIPPGAADYEVKAAREFERPVELLSLTPHMHLRGAAFRYEVARPGEPAEALLHVPRYDFNWQTTYRFSEPIELPAQSRIECVAHYDNSAANPKNPNPTQAVHRGEGTNEEMMIGFLEYARPLERRKPPPVPPALPASQSDFTWLLPALWPLSAVAIALCVLVAHLLLRRRVSSNP